MNNVFQNFWIPNLVEGMTTTTPTINKVNTMTPRQNDLVVKKACYKILNCIKSISRKI